VGGLPGAVNARGWAEIPFTALLTPREIRKHIQRSVPGGPLDVEMTPAMATFYSAHHSTASDVVAFRRRIRYYSASRFTDPSQCPTGLEINQDGALVGPANAGRAHRQFVFDLYQLQKSNPPKYAAFLDLVGKPGLTLISSLRWQRVKTGSSSVDVRVGGRLVKKKRERVLVIPTVTQGTDRLSFSQLSEGTFRTLALTFYLMADHSDLLLLEEPEVGVHRGLLVSLIELIKNQSRQKQILLSTHSDFVLDQVQPENVFAVKRTARGKTTVRALTETASQKELAALREYLATEGSLGDYWRTFGLES